MKISAAAMLSQGCEQWSVVRELVWNPPKHFSSDPILARATVEKRVLLRNGHKILDFPVMIGHLVANDCSPLLDIALFLW